LRCLDRAVAEWTVLVGRKVRLSKVAKSWQVKGEFSHMDTRPVNKHRERKGVQL
jgi:hypothetical protein